MDIIEFKEKYGSKTPKLLILQSSELLRFLGENGYYTKQMNEIKFKKILDLALVLDELGKDLEEALKSI